MAPRLAPDFADHIDVADDVEVMILAGGSSTRMGQNKARMLVDGIALLTRVVDAVAPLGNGAVTIVGGESDLTDLPGISSSQVTHVHDEFVGQGPLGGVITALRSANADRALIVACDLPRLHAEHLHHLVSEACATDADVCVPLVDGQFQWHIAIWNRRCLGQLEAVFQSGIRSIWKGVSDLRVTAVVSSHVRHVVDLDTPQDVADFVKNNVQRPQRPAGVYHQQVHISEIAVDALAALGESDSPVTLIDVREPHEYEEIHATGAVLIPLGEVLERKNELPDGPIHIICRSGARSMTACEALAPLGYDVTNIAGGTLAWVSAGYPSTTGNTPE